MRHSIVFRASRAALFVSAMMVVASVANAQVDSMAKWKPKVGDKFVYHHTYSGPDASGGHAHPRQTDDTVIVLIMDNNATIDSTVNEVVVARWGDETKYFQFQSTLNARQSDHQMIVHCNETGSLMSSPTGKFDYSFDYSQDTSSYKIVFEGNLISVYGSSWWFSDGIYERGRIDLNYSPELKWFCFGGGIVIGGDPGSDWMETWSDTLIAAVSVQADAPNIFRDDNAHAEILASISSSFLGIDIRLQSNEVLELTLLDPLARPIRSWSLDVASGESQVHLNVADVPSGVYFLKFSAPGVEEVRKVVIVH